MEASSASDSIRFLAIVSGAVRDARALRFRNAVPGCLPCKGSGAWPQSLLDNPLFTSPMLTATVCYGRIGYHWFEKPVPDRANALSKRRFKTGAPAVVP
jgi:hypothetical protein